MPRLLSCQRRLSHACMVKSDNYQSAAKRLHAVKRKVPKREISSNNVNFSKNGIGEDMSKKLVERISSSFRHTLKANFELATYYTHPRDRKNNDDDTSIIDRPKDRFKYEMLDFDFQSNLMDINKILRTPGCRRFKPVCAMIRGVGGGKTRTLEELKMKYNEYIPNCLAIATTYNLHWTPEAYELGIYSKELFPKTKDENDKIRIGVGLSMITRIVSMLYKTKLVEIIKNLRKYFPIQGTSYLDFELVLVALLTGIIEDVRERGGYAVDNLIIMVDETKRVQEMMSKHKVDENKDYLSILRQPVLGSDIEKYAKVKTAMILSSLTTENFVMTLSDRLYQPILLPNSLNPDLIVEKWWIPQLNLTNTKLTLNQKRYLTLLAATCTQSPRAAEVVGTLVAELFNESFKMDLSFFKGLMDGVVKDLSGRYYAVTLPTNEQMHALLFKYKIKVDNAILDSIMTGSLSNSFDITKKSIIPETSVIMMAMEVIEDRTTEDVRYTPSILNIYNSTIGQQPEHLDDGRILEKVMLNIFELKLYCDLTYEKNYISVHKLLNLPLDMCSTMSPYLNKCLRENLPKKSDAVIKKVHLSSYYKKGDKMKGFYSILADPNNIPSDDVPYIFFLPEKGGILDNSHDMMIAVYRGDDKPPLLIILEFKSRGVLSGSHEAVKVFDLSSMPNSGQQYINTKAHLLSNDIPQGIPLNGLLKQIRSTENPLPWVYVYMSTDEKYTQPYAVENCIVSASNDVYNFLGPFKYIYMAARGTYQLHKEK